MHVKQKEVMTAISSMRRNLEALYKFQARFHSIDLMFIYRCSPRRIMPSSLLGLKMVFDDKAIRYRHATIVGGEHQGE